MGHNLQTRRNHRRECSRSSRCSCWQTSEACMMCLNWSRLSTGERWRRTRGLKGRGRQCSQASSEIEGCSIAKAFLLIGSRNPLPLASSLKPSNTFCRLERPQLRCTSGTHTAMALCAGADAQVCALPHDTSPMEVGSCKRLRGRTPGL